MDFSDELFRALGRVTVNFQALENGISFFSWHLIGPDSRLGMIVTSQISFRRLCDLLDSLYRYRVDDPNRREGLAAILSRASQAETNRNTLIHSYWLFFKDGAVEVESRLKLTARRPQGLKMQFHQGITPDTVNKIADEFESVSKDLGAFMAEARKLGEITFPTSE